jgi:K+-dependent Na+/Ca+ exchanger-like protein
MIALFSLFALALVFRASASVWGVPGAASRLAVPDTTTTSRHLLQEAPIISCQSSCQKDVCPLKDYPPDVFDCEARQSGAILLHILGVLYMFFGLAISVDEYFVPALDVITAKLDISKDITGATFMAAGGSVPELFASFIGVFIAPDSNVGIGTIVGSAVFNVLFVVGFAALFSKDVLKLTWWPLFRDVMFYAAGLIFLSIFFADSQIELWEAFFLLAIYICYCTFMKFNERTEAWVKHVSIEQMRRQHEYYRRPINFRAGALHVLLRDVDPLGRGPAADQENRFKRVAQMVLQEQAAERRAREYGVHGHDLEQDDVEPITLAFPKGTRQRISYVFLFPLNALLHLTIPDVNKDTGYGRRYFALTFTLSLVWIALFSYLMVWWATAVGDALGIPTQLMGVTFLAAGTSIPDLLSSVIVARQGLGDMAVSSSIGSNIFDITVGLPLPWILGSLALYEGGPVKVVADGLLLNILTLFLMLTAVVVIIAAQGWKLTQVLGYSMIFLYCAFIAEVLLLEYA